MSNAVSKKSHPVYMSESVFKAFIEYASKQYPLKSYEVWENALVEYMAKHPTAGVNITVQRQIKESLPSKIELLRMSVIETKLKVLMEKVNYGEGDQNWLRETIGREVKRGLKIKAPTETFLSLLEEAAKHV